MSTLSRRLITLDALTLTPRLLGCVLQHETPEGVTSGRIVEAEAYMGPGDPCAHSASGKPTPRTAVMYGPGGVAYTYLIYGMYWCINIVAAGEGTPQCVLIRALEPLSGQELMARRRGTQKPEAWCSGPGKLCAAMGIGRAQNGADLSSGPLLLLPGTPPGSVRQAPRVGVGNGPAAAWLWRFYEDGNPHVSKR